MPLTFALFFKEGGLAVFFCQDGCFVCAVRRDAEGVVPYGCCADLFVRFRVSLPRT